MIRHKHKYRMVSHTDGCHMVQTIYSCQCGAGRVVTHERSIEIDPYSAVWMLDQDCDRCKDLLAGAEPISTSQELAKERE